MQRHNNSRLNMAYFFTNKPSLSCLLEFPVSYVRRWSTTISSQVFCASSIALRLLHINISETGSLVFRPTEGTGTSVWLAYFEVCHSINSDRDYFFQLGPPDQGPFPPSTSEGENSSRGSEGCVMRSKTKWDIHKSSNLLQYTIIRFT